MGQNRATLLVLATSLILQALAASFDASGAVSEWQRQEKAPGDAPVSVHVALGHDPAAHDTFEQTAWNIADPLSPHYRRHLSPAQLQQLLAPSDSVTAAVQSWLARHGISSNLRGDMLEATAPVAALDDALNCSYHVYTNGADNLIRTDKYFLPDDIADLVDFITPTTHFPKPRASRAADQARVPAPPSRFQQQQLATRAADDDCSFFVTPACIRKVYNITHTPQPNRTTFAVYGTEAATLRDDDLHTFLTRYNKPAAAANAHFTTIGTGDPADGSPGIGSIFETALDTQTSLGIAWPAAAVFYNGGGVFGPAADRGTSYDPFVTFLQELAHNASIPSVISFSESMPESMLDRPYAQRLCTLMAAAGARGASLLFSSGDNGPSGDQPSGKHAAPFEPEFPASCPWVTGVGGTTEPAAEVGATQASMHGGAPGYVASGGGFSNVFARPAYQDGDVPAYIRKDVPARYGGVRGFNAGGRGIPDVAALSTALPTVAYGLTVPVGGTSASTPVWAGVVTILNDVEAARGRAPLGFLNPWLYSRGARAGLRDVVGGGDSAGACFALAGCMLEEVPGYNVTAGWDAVTGLGVPDVGALIALLA